MSCNMNRWQMAVMSQSGRSFGSVETGVGHDESLYLAIFVKLFIFSLNRFPVHFIDFNEFF